MPLTLHEPSLKHPCFIWGSVEAPVLPGYKIQPLPDEFLRAEKDGRKYFVLNGGTHWILQRAEYFHAALVPRPDVETLAFEKCGTCFSIGYLNGHVCTCPAGQELLKQGRSLIVTTAGHSSAVRPFGAPLAGL